MNKTSLILGTMNIGQQVFQKEALEMLNVFLENGYNELDTAYVYNEGESERILGEVIHQIGRDNFKIATKVNPRVTGKLDAQSVEMQLNESLSRMKIDCADVLYLHFPDGSTPLEETLTACDKLHKQGKFKELGLSNYPVSDIDHALTFTKANSLISPTVYEGVYNALSRKVEYELMPFLNQNDIRMTVYNPLAGGMLTGRYLNYNEAPQEGRFTLRPNYQNRYWKPSYFEAVNLILNACNESDLQIVDASFKWLLFHSTLSKNDGVIIGASSVSQLKKNILSSFGEELPQNICEAMEKGWALTENDAPEYFRYYNT